MQVLKREWAEITQRNVVPITKKEKHQFCMRNLQKHRKHIKLKLYGCTNYQFFPPAEVSFLVNK